MAAALAVTIWGATPAATALAVQRIDPATVGVLRTVLAGVCLFPLIVVRRLPIRRRGRAWQQLLVSSVGGFVGFTLLFSIGLEKTSTAHAALIISSAPIVTGLLGFMATGAWPRYAWWIGAGVAFVGVTILVLERVAEPGIGAPSLAGDALVIAATLCAAAGYVAGARLAESVGTWSATVWSICIASLVMMPILWWRLANTQWGEVGALEWSAILYLALFASVVGYAAWYWSIVRAGVAQIAPIQFAQPIVSLVIAVVAFDEALTVAIVAALVLIAGGVGITRMKPSTTAPR